MTREQAPQQGVAEPTSTSATQADARVLGSVHRPKVTAPRPQGYGAAFGNGAGAAFVFRDLASI